MLKSGLLATIFFILSLNAFGQKYFELSGEVRDTFGQAISGANIRLRNDNLGTTTNENGYFKIRLEQGYYEIVVSALGYQNYSLNVAMSQNRIAKIVLSEKQTKLKEVEVSNKRHDPSWNIIQRVIANRNRINNGLENYKCEGYIKASNTLIVDSTSIQKKAKSKKNQPLNIDSVEANMKTKFPIISNMNFAEVNLTKYWGKPDKLKEERTGVRILGDKYSLYFLSVSDGEFDFYKNQVDLGKLSEVKYISPFSPGSNVSYKYKLIESYYEGERKIYKIKVTPRKAGNALFNGEVDIYDSLWIIKKVNFSLNPNHIPRFSSFSISQTYTINDSGYVLIVGQTFLYSSSAEKGKREGRTLVYYSSYQTNITLPKKFFGNEISSAIDSAYERNADWWEKQRRDSLSKNEKTYIHYKDSITLVHSSKAYLDSIDKVYNRVTPLKIIWWGQGHINRDKKVRIDYAPLVSTIQPGMIGGFRLSYFMQYFKRFENRKSLNVSPFISYGFLNEDIKGGIYVSNLYNPIKRSRLYFYAAREFQMINPNEAWINMFRRSNFYDQRRFQVGHSFEILNGLYLSNYISFSNRTDVGNYKFSRLGDSIFKTNNEPVLFPPHKSTEFKLILSYTPKQQYIREPKEKIILGSKYPTFTFVYNQGFKNILGSSVDFNYIQMGMSQTINYGRIGIGKYNIGTGKFFRKYYLPIVDYKYQRRGDPYLLTNPLATFQLLPQTFPTFNWYLEAHYWHSFNGFLTSAIPLFKRFNINASGGGSALLTIENNTKHLEAYVGLNKVFKLIRESFKVGVYFASGYNNQGGYYQGFKISIEQYNIRDNSWAF